MDLRDGNESDAGEVQDLEDAKRRFAEQRDAIRKLAQDVGGRLEVEANVAAQFEKSKPR